ncbi:uncharacterized protein LOC119383681 [Rhipicephalus sanguineus]|uniref:uncharacterized protein LOC119383681 n=1 Tax=Rhipicephalus sanguineus TaxID=34632 RepID=UPI0018950A87|nr:uncharacterized protein LOC119383681 [Rhipicephalus sanguineus]
MRGAIVGLILMASALIPVDAGVGSAVAKILARLPRALKAVRIMRPTGAVVRAVAKTHAETEVLFGLEAIHRALDFVPPPGGFQSGPEGYKGPGISGKPRKLSGATTWIECTSCKCQFYTNASFYEEKIGCTVWATLNCMCEQNSLHRGEKSGMRQ